MALNSPLRNDTRSLLKTLPGQDKRKKQAGLHRHLITLHQLSRDLAAIRDVEELQECLTATFARWLPGTTVRFFPHPGKRPASDHNPIGWTREPGLPVWIEDSLPSADGGYEEDATAFSRSIMALPLRFAGIVLGCLVIHASRPKRFSALDTRLVHLVAAHVSLALHNMLSQQQLAEASCRLRDQERKLAEVVTQLQELAHKDDLTGLYNKRSLLAQLDCEISRSRRYGGELSCLMIDLDGFKPINDTFGHLAGDQVLCQLGDLFRSCCRDSDFIARYGGDEFTVVLPQTGVQGAACAAEKLRRKVRGHTFVVGTGQHVFLSLSIGVITCSEKTWLESSEILTRADAALYSAKRAGGDATFEADPFGRESKICQLDESPLTQYAYSA